MSRYFEILAKEIDTAINNFETQADNKEADTSAIKLIDSIRALSGIKGSNEELIERAQSKIDDTELGQLLSLTIDLYKKHMETTPTIVERKIVKAIKYLINNVEKVPTLCETITISEDDTKIHNLFDKADVPAAAGQVDQAVIEKNDEKGGTPVDTGVFQKEEKISSIPDGYVEFDERIFGLKKKYCFKESATREDKTSRLYCRNTYSAQRPTVVSEKGYVFFTEGKQIKVRDLIRLTRGIGAVPVDPADYAEVSTHNHTTETSDELTGMETVNDSTIETTGDRSECKGSGIIKEDAGIMDQNMQPVIRSLNIDWLVKSGIPANKYVLWSNGEVYDTWHNRYLKPQTQNRGTRHETIYFLLSNGNRSGRMSKIKKETLWIKKDELMKKFG